MVLIEGVHLSDGWLWQVHKAIAGMRAVVVRPWTLSACTPVNL